MRRWWTAVAVGAVAVLALAGCGAPGGADGNLTDEWPGFGPAKGFVPENGACHTIVFGDKV